MSKKMYINKQKKGINFKGFFVGLLGLSVLATGSVVYYNYTVANNIKDIQLANEQTQQEIADIQGSINQLSEENSQVAEEIQHLEEILWRYEPVIIPESMQQ